MGSGLERYLHGDRDASIPTDLTVRAFRRLAQNRHPGCVFQDDLDLPPAADLARHRAQAMPNAVERVLPGVGRMTVARTPQAVSRRVRCFLDRWLEPS